MTQSQRIEAAADKELLGNTGKWCFHCRKDTHNDSECWSTRTVEPARHPQFRPVPPNLAVNIGNIKTPQWLLDKMRRFSQSRSGT